MMNKLNSTPLSRTNSIPTPMKKNTAGSCLPKIQSSLKSGAADEELFINSFENVPKIQLLSGRDLEQELIKIRDICSDQNVDWEKRNESLKRIRSLLIAGAAEYEELYMMLKSLELPFQISIKDLRSQIVREACITVAYMSTRIGIKCDKFAEALLPTIINLIQNSAKIMSSSGVVAIKFIIQHTKSPRLIPIITFNISSKSKEIRKVCCEFLAQLVHTWPVQLLEKHIGVLQDAIKKGISDADPEARAHSRKAFWGFSQKFNHEADSLLHSLDISKQKMLRGEHMTNSNSLNSINYLSYKPLIQTNGSIKSVTNATNVTRPSSSLSFKTSLNLPKKEIVSSPVPLPLRSTSAIDSAAQKRAKERAYLANMIAPKIYNPIKLPSFHNHNGVNSNNFSNSSKISNSNSNFSNFNSNFLKSNFNHSTSNSSLTSPNECSVKFTSVLSSLKNDSLDIESRKEVINDLIDLMREADSTEWEKYFHDIYHILLEKTSKDSNSSIRALTFRTVCDLLVKQTKFFNNFIHPTITRILHASQDIEKEVVRASEVTATTAVAVFPPDQIVKILTSNILNDSPVIIAAVKMLNKLIDQQPKEKVIELMPEMMPALIHAYDNVESAVRKVSVFCMVAIHCVAGDLMQPYLKTLNGSKMKLLKLYIDRAQNQPSNNSPVSTTVSTTISTTS